MMTHDFNTHETYLRKLGTQLVSHSDTNLHTHLVGVHHLLRGWGCPEHVALAGLYHSLYSTDEFHKFALPLTEREHIKGLIGEQAEQLVYLYCVATRKSWHHSAVSREKPRLVDRFTGARLSVTEWQFTELLWLWLANNIEIKTRGIEAYGGGVLKRPNFWRKVAERLGGGTGELAANSRQPGGPIKRLHPGAEAARFASEGQINFESEAILQRLGRAKRLGTEPEARRTIQT